MLNRGERVTDVTGDCFYGAIYARCTQPTTVRNCFWDEAMPKIGPAEGKTTESGNQALSTAQLTDGTLLSKLQATANGTTWVRGANGLPTIDGLPADPNVKPKAAKRLSVIGDSISTFRGWIPGVAIRNDASNAYGGTKPSDSIMASIYATADAAKTRSAINALPDGTFCEAYVKLMCQIKERYPQCKVVCIIGDYLSQSIEQSILEIAGHYGAKTVNLFRVNGFNDLGGYSPSTLSNLGRQPNMPKHDYSGDVSGCHPGS